MYNKRRKGFIAFITLFLLAIFGLIGIAYWYSSRMNTDMLYTESLRLKARNYAQAGIEKVKIHMCNVCQRNHDYDMAKNSNQSKEYKKEFEDGGYRVVSIKPFYFEGQEYKNVQHFVKGRLIGQFDVWEVTVEGYTKKNKIVVEIKNIIRLYHDSVVY
jgi:hypothetical protein